MELKPRSLGVCLLNPGFQQDQGCGVNFTANLRSRSNLLFCPWEIHHFRPILSFKGPAHAGPSACASDVAGPYSAIKTLILVQIPLFSSPSISALLRVSTTLQVFSSHQQHCSSQMPYQWNAERERTMLLLAVSAAKLKPSAPTWTAVAELLGEGLTPSAVRSALPFSILDIFNWH